MGSNVHTHRLTAAQFMARHRLRMARLIRRLSEEHFHQVPVGRFVRRVLKDLEAVGDLPFERTFLPGEDTFHWCLCALEDLADPSFAEPPFRPLLVNQIRQLKSMEPLLRHNRPLPPGYIVGFERGAGEADDEPDDVPDGPVTAPAT